MKKYAVLICGAKADDGFDEFWNDLLLIREALLKNNFPIENIYVLYGDGNDYNDANRSYSRYYTSPKPQKQSITDYPGDTINISNVFNGLANGKNNMPQLMAQDMLFVWTFGHGQPGIPQLTFNPLPTLSLRWNLVLNNGELMDNETFASLVNQVPYAYRIIFMQQCFSGGFIKSLKNNKTIILTACNQLQFANRCDDKQHDSKPNVENEIVDGITYHHGEFNYHLYSAIAKNTVMNAPVNADVDGNGFVTMKEVFDYIKKNDSIWTEKTQYMDISRNLGEHLHLDQI